MRYKDVGGDISCWLPKQKCSFICLVIHNLATESVLTPIPYVSVFFKCNVIARTRHVIAEAALSTVSFRTENRYYTRLYSYVMNRILHSYLYII
jgi:hypothetical protein